MLTSVAPALAQQSANSDQIETIVVTAQKRSENLQRVPLSIQALSTQKLEDLHISNFNDYVKFFPSVTYTVGGAGGGNAGPGFANISMRGIVSGNDGNHSGPLPTVGVYLDEQPITTIGGTLDLHVYDIDRVEVLSGPQGTLYGASSEAGTIRIITNKPDPSDFSAAYDLQANTVDHGNEGYQAEGYVNVPISDNAAIRIVAWDEHDAGYIDNVAGTRTYPGNQFIGGNVPPITINNFNLVKNNFNDVDTYGARAALKIDLNANWTVTPSVVAQWENSNGIFGYDQTVGYLQVKQYNPDFVHQNWVQAALTVQGKIGDLDLTYAGGHMDWWIHGESDYSDYSYWYDKLFPASFPQYFYDNNGKPIAPTQYIVEEDHFIKDSHELRIASPATDRLRFIGGLFYERQQHWILQDYKINDLACYYTVDCAAGTTPYLTGLGNWPNTIWLTDQERVDQDLAAFADVSYDIMPKLTLNGGLRLYDYRNTLAGFFGFNGNFSSHTGESQCFAPGMFHNAPCTDLDAKSVGTGNTHKINLTYRVDDDRMVYFTWSTGFRPGGVNRRSDVAGPYSPDKLTNYEVGWKTTWLNDTLRLNGALFREDWDNVQFPFLGANSFTIIQNAGNATSQGIESDFEWKPISAVTVSGSGAVTDANLDTPYCGFSNPVTKQPITSCPNNLNPLTDPGADPWGPDAPAGTQLPITPKWKGNLTTRYDFSVLDSLAAHVQGSLEAQSGVWDDLRVQAEYPTLLNCITQYTQCETVPIRSALGKQPGFATFDFSTGIDADKWFAELFVENAFDSNAQQYRYTECTTQVCANAATPGGPHEVYVVPQRPRLIGIKFGQRF
ncbi:MAG: TonB-dependent receptor [Rhizomicrobium sp.]|jgi:outer membrane receptor protein involved in Fe transport